MPLSSSLTFMLRTVLPASWAAILPVALLVPLPHELEPMRRFFLVALALLLLQSAAYFVRLKEVHAEADGLLISDGRVSARVPWAQVAAIKKPWWGEDVFARIELRTPTRFGSRILFMMSIAPFTRWRNHPSVRAVNAHMAAAQPRPDQVGTAR
jgi:hypothetical protein